MHARALIAGLALLGAIGTAALASGTARRVVGNCFKSQDRPGTIILACADDNAVLIHLHWRSFGGASARANGTYYANDCVPYCAAGRFHSYPAALVFSRARSCPDGYNDYRLASITFTGKRPRGFKATDELPLFCPLKA